MFLKYFYKLDWWASILTNAEEKEITTTLWPYVKDMVMSPDINLSGDTMTPDYGTGKIRSKLGMIRGMGEASAEPILKGRPYKGLNDFVEKEVAGPSLARKLIHVGVLDSLFPPKSTLIEKLKLYEDAVEVKKFKDKLNKAEKEGKKIRQLQPKDGKVPEEYLNLTPIQEASMKKSILPSLPLDLFSLGSKHSKVRVRSSKPMVMNNRGYETILVPGSVLQKLSDMEGETVKEDIYFASTCYVVDLKEFSYPKNKPSKRALKLVLDADGYINEKVLWPDYDTGELIYPKELKKGSIATIFFRKRTGKKDINITSIVLET